MCFLLPLDRDGEFWYNEVVKHEYTLNGTQIVAETWDDHILLYIYDELNTPAGLKYRNSTYAEDVYDCYFFEKNIFGDIVGIYKENGTKIGGYTYDAWGNFTVNVNNASFGTLDYEILRNYNPFRYRGYFYDVETGLYYLQSRYYNAEWGRFMNADTYVSTGQGVLGYNMYAYCGNNPVMRYDPTGEEAYSKSFEVFAFLGAGFSYSISCAVDDKGNIALQYSKADPTRNNSGVVIGVADVGISGAYSRYDVETVFDLEGPSFSVGGGKAIGNDTIYDMDGNKIGKSVSKSISPGIDVLHVKVTQTETLWSFNVYDVYNEVKNFMQESYQTVSKSVKKGWDKFASLFKEK